MFSFTNEELDYLEKQFRERIAIQRELFPFDDPNYGIDEQWAFLYPHGCTVASGEIVNLEMRITNHSPVEREFTVTPHVPANCTLDPPTASIKLAPRQSGSVKFSVTVSAASGAALVTADIKSDGMDFREWAEAVITVR